MNDDSEAHDFKLVERQCRHIVVFLDAGSELSQSPMITCLAAEFILKLEYMWHGSGSTRLGQYFHKECHKPMLGKIPVINV
eukprot:g1673.t1